MKVSQLEQLQLDAEYRAFPSPCGVLGMKAAEIQAIDWNLLASFRPLAGFWE